MKPHSLRSGLWVANLALAAAVVAAGAWYMAEVKPAVADITNRKANYRPPEFEELRKAYEGNRVTGLKWKPQAPVSDKEIHEVILRADYKRKKPTHWIFSGPLPPIDTPDDAPVETGPPPPAGLDSLGKILTVIINPPSSTILFKFTSGKSRPFGVGDFIRLADGDPARFQLTGIVEVREKVYQVGYGVYGKDKDKPERTEVLMYDRSGTGTPWAAFLRPVDTGGAPAGAAVPDGTNPAGAPAGTTPAGAPAGTEPGTGGSATPEPAATEVVIATTKRDEDLTVEDLKPLQVLYKRDNRNERGIRLDETSYRFLKSKNAKSVAETVKTAVAKDASGRVIGLRITGFAPDAPADVFDVKQGDILVSINGQQVSSREDAVRIAQGLDATKLVRVVIDRRGRLITYNVDPQDPRNQRRIRYFEDFGE